MFVQLMLNKLLNSKCVINILEKRAQQQQTATAERRNK